MLFLKKKVTTKKSAVKKVKSGLFRPYVLSRHPSHNPLRSKLAHLPFRSLIRLGSTTVLTDGKKRVEINSVKGVQNSSSKLLMKQCFEKAGISHAKWFNTTTANSQGLKQWARELYPIIAKSFKGSRGVGNHYIENEAALNRFISNYGTTGYIFEKYYSYTREYRLHVTKDGCFYTCRKMLKKDTPKNERFQRHDNNSAWYLEDNPEFDKPSNWNAIVSDCVKALKALELDICCFDVKVQSTRDKNKKIRPNPEYIIIESGSAPSFGNVTLQKYLQVLPDLIRQKHAYSN